MIDPENFIGTPSTFNPEKIKRLEKEGNINSVAKIEKAIFALEFLAQLQIQDLKFLFKGGSAVQILLGDKWNRLSVDIDIFFPRAFDRDFRKDT